MMTFNDFCNKIKMDVEWKLGSSYIISLNTVTKVNTIQTALSIQKKKDSVAQNIYLEDFYEQYQNGRSIISIVDNLIRLHQSTPDTIIRNLPSFTDFAAIKDKIAYKIINTKKNQQLLEDIPHKSFFNLSIVLYCFLGNMGDCTASLLIHNSHLQIWNIDFDSLLKIAFDNTQKLFPLDIKGINQIFASFDSNKDSHNNSIEDLDEDIFYVLTNNSQLNGFGCILYPDILESFAKRFGNFYILPSSLHEALLVPVRDDAPQDLLDMVKTVNATEVAPEDFLADSVYFYNSVTNQIEM